MFNAYRRKAAILAQSEIDPDIALRRIREARRRSWGEVLAIVSFVGLFAVFAFVWLAYEGWITPASFN